MMKKYDAQAKLRIGVVIISILFILFILPYGVIFRIPKIMPVSAQNGYSGTPSVNKLYLLNGEWEFYPNRLYSPEDFRQGIASAQSEASHVTFPHYWKDDPELFPKSQGYATYRLRLDLPSEFTDVGIYSRYQYSAYRIYINGIETTHAGRVSKDLDEHYVSFLPTVGYQRPLVSDWAEPTHENTVPIDIVVQIQNYDHISGGFTQPMLIGTLDNIRVLRSFLLFANGLFSGGLVLLFSYFFVVYLQTEGRSNYLDFSIVVIMCAYITLASLGESIAYNAVPFVDWKYIYRAEYAALIIAGYFANNFTLVRYLKPGWQRKIAPAFAIATVLAIYILPTYTISKYMNVLHGIALSFFLTSLVFIVKAFIKKRKMESVLEFVSLLTLVIGVLSNKIGLSAWDSLDMFPVFVVVYCFVQINVFLDYYSVMERDLRDFTENLETLVLERTAEAYEMKRKAEAATAAKSEFLALMSHEIRTPMNAIIGLSDIMRTDNLDEAQKSYFNDIKAVSHSLLYIINDILDFSKIESGKFEILNVSYNIKTLLDNVCSMTYFAARSKELFFESDISDDIPSILYGDEIRVRQIITNILNNAVKYTVEGFVKLSASVVIGTDGKELCLSVTDSGVGIKDEDIGRLFDSFEQVDTEKNRGIIGTGLGLAITKRLCEMMNGRITVESSYGVGSTFRVYLPLVLGNPDEVEELIELDTIVADNVKVLVVDDNSINLTVAMAILATHRIVPDTAQSGQEALEKVYNTKYDVIFMDHMMPDMDGIETTERIRALGDEYKYVPIIALTANAVHGTKELLMSKGMNDFLTKPIDRTALNNILIKWLDPGKYRTKEIEPDLSEMDEEDIATLRALKGIDGLNVERGIDNTGASPRAYIRILGRFVSESMKYAETLYEQYSEEDYKNYGINIHGIKGSLRSIGAEVLANAAAELEIAAKTDRLEFVAMHTEEFCCNLTGFSDLLRPIVCIVPDAEKEEADPTLLSEILPGLTDACKKGHSSEADKFAERLKGLSFGEDYDVLVTEICSLIETMDLDIVIEKIEALSLLLSNI